MILNFNPTAREPFSFTGGGGGGDIVIFNPGQTGRIDLTIHGAVENPRVVVENSAGVRTLLWEWALGVGEFLEVDPQRHRSLLQGQASRPPVVRQWPTLTHGTNIFRFRADAYTDTALLVVSVLPAD